MAKIILIDPPGWQGATSGYNPYPNIGIAYLIPMLQRHGHEVLLIDLNNEAMTDKQVLAIIDEFHPNIIGFSVKTATMKNTRKLAQQAKSLLPETPIILGGPHATLTWQKLIIEDWIDIVFIGEGEQILPIICEYIMENKPLESLPGVITGNILQENFRVENPLITDIDLDNLPFPEYNLFPRNVREFIYNNYPLVTSRGCIYKCTYCSVPLISGRKFRKRSPQNIIEELRWAKKRYGITAFEIVDDLFNFDISRCKEICQALIKANLGLSWSCPNGLRADRIDKELAELMFKAGCRSVMVGVESADSEILATVKKGETIDDIKRGIHILKKSGMEVGGYFIIGLPGDSLKSQEHSVEFVRKEGIHAHFNMLVPYPGTELWEWTKANAHFLRDIEGGLHFANSSGKVIPVFETDDFPAEERQRAYDMVHTQLKLFNMLIPNNLSRWQHHCRLLRLLWRYDRKNLFMYILQRVIKKFWKMFGKG